MQPAGCVAMTPPSFHRTRRRSRAAARFARLTALGIAIVWVSASIVALPGRLTGEETGDFVQVAAGPFTMGADPARDADAFDNEKWSAAGGEGVVTLATFYIARYEVTIGEFAAFARANTWAVDPRALAGAPTHPVTFVSWPDALAYCRWLQSTLTSATSAARETKALLANGWRVTLPSEAEWEKAARGTDRRKYPWGDAPQPGRANYGGAGTTPVGFFACPECPYGLSDMSGNVWEWTRSPYQPYPYDPGDDRANLDVDALWVIRGGHFGDGPRLVRTTTRAAADPGARRPFIGFRVVITREKAGGSGESGRAGEAGGVAAKDLSH